MMKNILKNLFHVTSDDILKQSIQDGAFVVDVRTPEEFAEGSIKGAINIPLNEVQNKIDKFNGKEKIVVFCKSGGRSGQAKKIIEKNEIQNVFNGGGLSNMQGILSELE